MVGPLLGGYLAALGGFSAPFYAAAIIGALMIPIPLLMRDSKAYWATSEKEQIDSENTPSHDSRGSFVGSP